MADHRPILPAVLVLMLMSILPGCSASSGAQFAGGVRIQPTGEQMRAMAIEQDRQAILKMVGTFKVEFDFEETLALREGYELHKPYHSEAEELVVLVEDRVGFISLQHLLVVRHEGEAHVIKHWREDWAYEGEVAVRFEGGDTWKPGGISEDSREQAWVKTVYNADDSPRYTSVGRWRHDGRGLSTWDGSEAARPVPLRESHLSEQYDILLSENSLVVSSGGWLHLQRNKKWDTRHAGGEDMLAFELGVNRYTRIADMGFEQAHDYWKNTSPFWVEVRKVWAQVIDKHEGKSFTVSERWKGDPLFSHLFGLADDYWGKDQASEARPKIQEIIEGFLDTRS